MRTGAWAAACLLLTILTKAALPAEVYPIKHNRFDIPINVDLSRKADIQGLELYVSTDQGKTWSQRGNTTPESTEFKYTAEVDGEFWFNVLIVDRNNRKEPATPNGSPPEKILKVLVDTLKPEVKLRAERQGDSVSVNWEIREEHPRLNTFRLEWKPADGPENWTPVQASANLTGQASIRTTEAIVVRGTIDDIAENKGKDEAKVPAATGAVAALGPGVSSPVAPVAPPATEFPPPLPGIATTDRGAATTLPTTDSAAGIRRVSTSPPAPKVGTPPGGVEEIGLPPAVTTPTPSPAPAPAPIPATTLPDRAKPESIAVTPTVTTPSPIGPPTAAPVPPVVEKVPAVTGAAPSAPPALPTAPPPAPASSAKNELQVINTKRVTMEYEVSKVGPSGVGSVDVYLTRNDGMAWTLSNAEHQAVSGDNSPGVMRRTVSVDLPEDGIYGFYMVAKSGAGMSKPAPRPGLDVPQMRVKLDTTLPSANLFRPKKDKAHPDALFIMWSATDSNLTAAPVSIQWAEKPSGPWETIGTSQMANTVSDPSQIPTPSPSDTGPAPTGSFTWQVPTNIPANVYLRLTVRDAAGNVAIAETDKPISIDLSEPDVSIRGIVGIRPH